MSDADGSSDEEVMVIPLTELPTIRQLYSSKILKSAAKPRYPLNDSLLNKICLYQGDITKLELDSIVNAANKSLLGGGGVDGAIHSAAGPELLKECEGLNGCEIGQSKITKGYKLPAKHVIHTVGPIYSRSDVENRAKQLASCYKTSLMLAVDNSLKHVAFPSVSTGIYGYPIEDATHIALDETRRFCDAGDADKLDQIIFVVWSNKDKWTYEELIPEYFPSNESPEEGEVANEEEPKESKEENATAEKAALQAETSKAKEY